MYIFLYRRLVHEHIGLDIANSKKTYNETCNWNEALMQLMIVDSVRRGRIRRAKNVENATATDALSALFCIEIKLLDKKKMLVACLLPWLLLSLIHSQRRKYLFM